MKMRRSVSIRAEFSTLNKGTTSCEMGQECFRPQSPCGADSAGEGGTLRIDDLLDKGENVICTLEIRPQLVAVEKF